MAVSFFAEYSQEVVSAVGEENAVLLDRIDSALNSAGVDNAVLEMCEEDARKAAHAEGVSEGRYFAFLALLHEIEYRKSNPSARCGRRPVIVPCPGWLPPNSRQISARRMPYFRMFNKLFVIAMIVVIFGVFPFFVAPVSHCIVVGGSLSLRAAISVLVWLSALAAALFGCCALRFLKRK